MDTPLGAIPDLSGEISGETFYRIDIPLGASSLKAETRGGEGDVELLLGRGRVPVCQLSLAVFSDCDFDDISLSGDNDEFLEITDPPPGQWFITLAAFETYSGVTLEVSTQISPGSALGRIIKAINSASATSALTKDSAKPSLYAVGSSGSNVAAAASLRVAADGTRSRDLAFDHSTGAAIPVDLGQEGDETFLLLFGTGFDDPKSEVRAAVGGEKVSVALTGLKGQFSGITQLKIGPLPRSLTGSGEVDLILTVDGKTAKPVTVNVQ